MTFQSCKADAATEILGRSLIADHSISDQELDNGYRSTAARNAEGRTSAVVGANDGCSSYQEVLNTALNTITAQTLQTCGGSSSLLKLLAETHQITIPWIPYTQSPSFDFDAVQWEGVTQQLESLRRSIVAKGTSESSPAFRREFAQRILTEMMPQDRIDRFDPRRPMTQQDPQAMDPFMAPFGYYAFAQAAGLSPRFVLISSPGESSPFTLQHVGIEIAIDSHRTVVIDPVFGRFDVGSQNAQSLDPSQALSMHYLHAAHLSTQPQADLELAHRLDPSNVSAMIYLSFAKASTHDPLQLERENFWLGYQLGKQAIETRISNSK